MWLKENRAEKPMAAAGLAKQKQISLMRKKKKLQTCYWSH